MTYDLTSFSLSDMTACGAALRQMDVGAASMEEVANRTVRYFYERLVDESGQPTTVLVRFFITHPYQQLEPDLRRQIQATIGGSAADPDMKCFTLLATAGIEPSWNRRQLSTHYRVHPLTAQMIERYPMFSQVYKEFGVDIDMVVQPDPDLLAHWEAEIYNVFHVADAANSPHIPDQADFVIPYGVRSVLGFFGMLPSGNHFTLILFSKAMIPRETSDYFKTLALNVKMAVLPFDNRVVFDGTEPPPERPNSRPQVEALRRQQVASLTKLLGVHERVVQEQSARLEMVVAELESQLAENARLRRQATEAAVVEERRRLARDLHDSVTQALYSQTLYAEAAARQIAGGNIARANDHLRQLQETAQQALREMRLLIFELRPPALEAVGLMAALRARLDAVEARTGIKSTVTADETVDLTLNQETGLYWIAQEALNNALKYAQATSISVTLAQESDRIKLQITDDGVGFEGAAGPQEGMLGLRGMQERATQLGWRFFIDSSPGQGTTIQVEAPHG